VLIRGDDAAVDLRPERWQFAPDAGPWDDRWIVVRGAVELGGRSWAFEDPCLLVDEAREVAGWLTGVARGRPGPDPREDDGPELSFTEPVLGFSAGPPTGGEVVVRVHLAQEAAPPWLTGDSRLTACVVEVRLPADRLPAAADAWARELAALPPRSFASTE